MSARGTFQLVSGCGLSTILIASILFWISQTDTRYSLGFLFVVSLVVLWGWWCAFQQLTSRHPYHWFRTRMGWGHGLGVLAKRLDIPVDELASHQPRYSQKSIRKRSGGIRLLQIPDQQTADLQKRILRRLLTRLNSHELAMGFEKNRSIVHNALPHVGKAVVIKLDIVDFFPNTSADRIEAYFKRIGWNVKTAKLLTKLTCFEGGLPQGAATSPRLSNLINILIDKQLSDWATYRRGEYTRYADDITFSFPKDYPNRIRGVIQMTRKILKRYGYQLHPEKQRILRQHQRQTVTGLNVNSKVSLPRKLRRRLRAARHRLEQGQEATWSKEQLEGWSALEQMISQQSESQ